MIYTDGSSQSHHRHIDPAYNEEIDVPDAWCFVVLGQKYNPGEESDLSRTHQVPYAADTLRVGSLVAEREALSWAMLWRLGLNVNTPTLLRSDSMLTIGQARGSIGVASCDLSFQTLRGCYHLLETLLGDDVGLDHVYGHLHDPWNEMADSLARQEAKRSFYLRRPAFGAPKLVKKLPFLWMIFDSSKGTPPFFGSGFNACPPALPPEQVDPTDSLQR